ncbi:fimbrial protein [Shewanella sp. MBTL60-007]|uniref:fimbrial protein n=1 Tax=Shewanella sp. MBTL60-007 TaxID=2815911 RepID=UPI001BBD9CF8|nr:hypothetical protein [Shewanella sp. MBTL60-007]GIU19454.1 hypothetical protein TUM3792_16940 [Shewanella sp. MBTL60-007]
MGLSIWDYQKVRLFKLKWCVLLAFTIGLLIGLNATAYASIPSNSSWQGQSRCSTNSSNGEWTLVAELQNTEVSINTSVGEVITTVAPVGGQWNFYCNRDYDYPAYPKSGHWLLGFPTTFASGWIGDPTVCLLPEFNGSGMGVRFYNADGDVVPCGMGANQSSNRLITIANGSLTTANYSGVFAEIVRVGTIPAGTYSLPNFSLYSLGWEKGSYTASVGKWDLQFVHATFEAANCFMAGHNQTIDFGERTRGSDVYTKSFDIWLTGCDGQDLIDFKASAKLSFASSRINMSGTRLANCNDTDCADGAYITFTDLEGDNVNLFGGYDFNAQANSLPNRISFNANLHTENTTAGKIDTNLTLIVEYL